SALVFQLTITACKSRDAETSKLWSIRTGEDFVRLLTLGRSVAEHNQAQGQGSSLALTKGASSYGGVAAADAVWEPVDDTLIHARFDTTKTPAIPPSKLPAEALSIVNTMASALGVKPSELQPMPSLSLSDPSLIDQNRLDQNIAAQTASPKSAASQVSDAYITVLGDWTTVHFARVISSIPVRDARIDVSFAKREGSWHLAEITNRGWGKSPEAGSEQTSLLSLTDLASVTGMKDLKILKTGAQYIPVKDSQKATTLRRSNWYYVVGPDGLAYTLTFSGAEEPILVEAFSNRYDAIVQAESFATSWANSSRVFVPLVGASYSTGGAKQTLDDSGGLSTVDPGGSIQLSGKIARVRSQQSGSTNLAVKKNGDGWIVHVDDSNRSEVNAYTAIVRIRGLAQQHLSDANTGYFRKTLDVTTRISGKCNAYYQSRTLKFFQQNEGCADMATVNDVVMHEWGHGLDDHTGPGQTGGGGITDGAFSEGIGDIVAFTYSGQNKMAMGFFTNDPTKYLRNAVNTLRYNGTQMEIHKEGTIIGGAFWELRRRLINKYGESTGARRGAELFFKHLAFADNYQASYNIPTACR
ncbi:MAG: M36 family metallopeptidase, partial [Proteobacteria bacterium]|nr:M36 family metallopeptidase [Pseudomonadota bacterium]